MNGCAARGIGLVALALLPPALALLWWANTADEVRQVMLAGALYWTAALIVVLALTACWWRWRARAASAAQLAKQAGPGALLALALTATVVWAVPPTERVQFDETSLAGVAQNMHDHRLAVMTTGAVPQDGQVARIENTVDKRPPLFPFLVSLLHDLRGHRLGHAFAVNAALLALALFAAFAAARARLGAIAAVSAPLLLLALPLTTLVATSAGFELLAATLFGLVLLAALDFVQHPDTVRWAMLLAAGVLFAQSRYESLPALVVVLGLVLWGVRRRWRPDRRAGLLAAACPALLAPVVVLLAYSRDPRFYPEAGGQELVSLQHAHAHFEPFLAAMFDPALSNPLPGVLAIAAALAWLVRAVRRDAKWTDNIVVLPVLAVTASALLWFIGDVREAIALRLFVPFAWLCALSPLLVLRPGARAPALALLAAALALAALRVPTLRTEQAFVRGDKARIVAAIDACVARMRSDPARTLWITTAAQRLIVTGHAALSPERFAWHAEQAGRPWLRSMHVFVLETPLDAAMAPGLGDPRAILRALPGEVVERTGGDVALTVHRLRP